MTKPGSQVGTAEPLARMTRDHAQGEHRAPASARIRMDKLQ